jgi:GNAT superfamily N-acetyltransferase
MMTADQQFSIVLANQVACDDLQAVFGSRGTAANCQCQRYKLLPKESFNAIPVEVRGHRFREQTNCGDPGSAETSGLVAYLDDRPVGWCAVEPRPAFGGLVRNGRIPWLARDEEKSDDSVWAVTCLFARVGFRRRGVSRALARAAAGFARDRGARAIEAYPLTHSNVLVEELHVGTCSTYAAAGFREVARPTPRRAVMRIDFSRFPGDDGHERRVPTCRE